MQSILYSSPVGLLEISVSDNGIRRILFKNEGQGSNTIPEGFNDVVQQLDEYFNGDRKEFQLKLDIKGTEFQQRVWNQLLKIPFGSTISYLELAKRLGDPKCIRAAGTANGRNPIVIVIPCHRVIGSDGSLIGFGGGLNRKKILLDHEASYIQGSLF